MIDSRYANVDANDTPAYFEAVYMAVQEAIVSVGNPAPRVMNILGTEARMVNYDPEVAFSAVMHVLASFAIQSGNYVTPRARRQLADALRAHMLTGMKAAEKQFADMGRDPEEPQPKLN